STRKAVLQARRLSGLTWKQLAELFRVSRRTVHAWASGQPLNSANESHLRRTLDVLQAADRGRTSLNRAALLDIVDGQSPFSMLAAEDYEGARKRLRTSKSIKRVVLRPLSD